VPVHDSIFPGELLLQENIARSFMVYGNIRSHKVPYDQYLSTDFKSEILGSFQGMLILTTELAKWDIGLLKKYMENPIRCLQKAKSHQEFVDAYKELLKFGFDSTYESMLVEQSFFDHIQRFLHTIPASEEDLELLHEILGSVPLFQNERILALFDEHVYSKEMVQTCIGGTEGDTQIQIDYMNVLFKQWSRDDAKIPPKQVLEALAFKSLSCSKVELPYVLESFLSLSSNRKLVKEVDGSTLVNVFKSLLLNLGVVLNQQTEALPKLETRLLILILNCIRNLTILEDIKKELFSGDLVWLCKIANHSDADIQSLGISIIANCSKTLTEIQTISTIIPKFLDKFIELVQKQDVDSQVKKACIDVINNCIVAGSFAVSTSNSATIDISGLINYNFLDPLSLLVSQYDYIPLLESISLLLINISLVLPTQAYNTIMKSSLTTHLIKKSLYFNDYLSKDTLISKIALGHHSSAFVRMTRNVAAIVSFQTEHLFEQIQNPLAMVQFMNSFSMVCCGTDQYFVLDFVFNLLDKRVFLLPSWNVSIQEIVTERLLEILIHIFNGKEKDGRIVASQVLERIISLVSVEKEELVKLLKTTVGISLINTQFQLLKKQFHLVQFDDELAQYSTTCQILLQKVPLARESFQNSILN
jgi:hypothetical protein